MSKATLSALIKRLKEKNYLYFHEDPDDIRKKRVLPTEKLLAEKERFLQETEQMEAEICNVLDRQEKIQLRNLEQKLIRQFAEMEKNEKNRQEVYLQ